MGFDESWVVLDFLNLLLVFLDSLSVLLECHLGEFDVVLGSHLFHLFQLFNSLDNIWVVLDVLEGLHGHVSHADDTWVVLHFNKFLLSNLDELVNLLLQLHDHGEVHGVHVLFQFSDKLFDVDDDLVDVLLDDEFDIVDIHTHQWFQHLLNLSNLYLGDLDVFDNLLTDSFILWVELDGDLLGNLSVSLDKLVGDGDDLLLDLWDVFVDFGKVLFVQLLQLGNLHLHFLNFGIHFGFDQHHLGLKDLRSDFLGLNIHFTDGLVFVLLIKHNSHVLGENSHFFALLDVFFDLLLQLFDFGDGEGLDVLGISNNLVVLGNNLGFQFLVFGNGLFGKIFVHDKGFLVHFLDHNLGFGNNLFGINVDLGGSLDGKLLQFLDEYHQTLDLSLSQLLEDNNLLLDLAVDVVADLFPCHVSVGSHEVGVHLLNFVHGLTGNLDNVFADNGVVLLNDGLELVEQLNQAGVDGISVLLGEFAQFVGIQILQFLGWLGNVTSDTTGTVSNILSNFLGWVNVVSHNFVPM